MFQEFKDIPSYKTWINVKKIEKGWSKDRKYYIEDNKGISLLLRISDISLYESKKKEFEMIKKFNKLSFTMSKALEFGKCNKGKNVYMILSWVQGQDLGDIIESLPKDEQYELGLQAGTILKEIHSIKVDNIDIPIKDKKEKKLMQLEIYENSKVRVENDRDTLEFIKNNIDKICKGTPVYEHGDFHIGNLLLTEENKIGVIDFNRWECGDKYEEFYKIQSFNIEKSIPFSKGQINGYFNNKPPEEFWSTLAVYVAHASLYSITWAQQFTNQEIKAMTKRYNQTLKHYNNFKTNTPLWYK